MQRRNGQHGSFYNRVTRCDESRFNNLWVDKGNFQPQHNSTTYYPDTSINFSQPVKRVASRSRTVWAGWLTSRISP